MDGVQGQDRESGDEEEGRGQTQTREQQVLDMMWVVLSTHLVPSDLKRLVLTILSTLPTRPPWHAGSQGGQSSASVLASAAWKLEEAGGQVHVRNLLLNLLLRLIKHLARNEDQSESEQLHRVLTPGLMLHILSRRVHPSSMSAVLELLTLHLAARPKHAKRFVDSGGLEHLKDVMAGYSACPHAYLLLLHALLGAPVASMPQVLDAESFRLYLAPLEEREVVFAEALDVMGIMLQRASSMCEHLEQPAVKWTSLCSIRTSLISQPPACAWVEGGEMLGFVSELIKSLKHLFTSNLSFRMRCLNDALFVCNMLSIVLPSPWDMVDSKVNVEDSMLDVTSGQATSAPSEFVGLLSQIAAPLLRVPSGASADEDAEREAEDGAHRLQHTYTVAGGHLRQELVEGDLDAEASALNDRSLEEIDRSLEEISPLEYAWLHESCFPEDETGGVAGGVAEDGVAGDVAEDGGASDAGQAVEHGRARPLSLEPAQVSLRRLSLCAVRLLNASVWPGAGARKPRTWRGLLRAAPGVRCRVRRAAFGPTSHEWCGCWLPSGTPRPGARGSGRGTEQAAGDDRRYGGQHRVWAQGWRCGRRELGHAACQGGCPGSAGARAWCHCWCLCLGE